MCLLLVSYVIQYGMYWHTIYWITISLTSQVLVARIGPMIESIRRSMRVAEHSQPSQLDLVLQRFPTFPDLSCARCERRWRARGAHPPKKCPGCFSPYWHVARGVLPRGRPIQSAATAGAAL
jgi:hypothetical protein